MFEAIVTDSKIDKSLKISHLLSGVVSYKVIENVLSQILKDKVLEPSKVDLLKSLWVKNLTETHSGIPKSKPLIDKTAKITRRTSRLTEEIQLPLMGIQSIHHNL